MQAETGLKSSNLNVVIASDDKLKTVVLGEFNLLRIDAHPVDFHH